MSHSIHPATKPSASANHASPKDDAVRSLAIRRVELACFARHLARQRRRHQEQEEHLKHTRKQVDALLERSRQQVAHIQANSPERIAELEKALSHAKGEATRLGAAAAQLPALEKALAQARGDLEAQRRDAGRMTELEQALRDVCTELESRREEVAGMAADKAKLEKGAADLEQTLSQARQELTASRKQIEQLSASLGNAVQSVERIAELETLLTDAAREMEARDQKIAELSAAPPAPNPERIAELETLLTDAATELEARDQKIAELSAAPPAPNPERIAELETLLTDAASELEARDQKIAELSAASPSSAPTTAGGISEELLLQLRTEIEATVQVEVERLHRDLDAFRKGNVRLRQELEAAQSGQAKPAAAEPPPDVEPIKKENEDLKARLSALEGDVQKLVQENEQFRVSVREQEEVRENLERETAQFNQQRHLLEEEVQALRKKVEGSDTAKPDLASVEMMMEGDIVEPSAVDEVNIEEPELEPPPTPVVPVDLTDGFDFPRQDAGLVAMQRQLQAEQRSLELELSDPNTPREERSGVDLSEQKLTIDQLLVEVRKARAVLTGKASGPAVVVAAPQQNRPKPRSTFQGLRRWLRGRE